MTFNISGDTAGWLVIVLGIGMCWWGSNFDFEIEPGPSLFMFLAGVATIIGGIVMVNLL